MTLQIRIEHLEVRTDLPDFPKAVKTVHWRIIKTDQGHTADIYGAQEVGDPQDPFTDFENLIEQQVIDWLALDLSSMEAALDARLAQLINPPVVGVTPPWATAAQAPSV